MSIPILVLLGFAGWTLLILLLTVGWYRLSRVFTGGALMNDFEADGARGAYWYQRALAAFQRSCGLDRVRIEPPLTTWRALD